MLQAEFIDSLTFKILYLFFSQFWLNWCYFKTYVSNGFFVVVAVILRKNLIIAHKKRIRYDRNSVGKTNRQHQVRISLRFWYFCMITLNLNWCRVIPTMSILWRTNFIYDFFYHWKMWIERQHLNNKIDISKEFLEFQMNMKCIDDAWNFCPILGSIYFFIFFYLFPFISFV